MSSFVGGGLALAEQFSGRKNFGWSYYVPKEVKSCFRSRVKLLGQSQEGVQVELNLDMTLEIFSLTLQSLRYKSYGAAI